METSSFIKTTAFGGYDKTDANRFIESLYSQIYDLKSRLDEKDALLESYKKDASAEDTYHDILEAERAKLTEANTFNQMLSTESAELKAEAESKDREIEKLTAQVNELNATVNDLNGKLDSLTDGKGAAALSKVFIEAQKSADELVADSQKQADELKADAEKLVNNMIIEANNNAAKIVYEAEKKAAETEAKSKSDYEKMSASSENMRSVMLSEIKSITETMTSIKELFQKLEDQGIQKIGKSEELLSKTENKLLNGGIPVFRNPAEITPEYPSAPVLGKTDYNYNTGRVVDKEKISMLEDVARQAELLNGKSANTDPDLEALAKQAASLSGKTGKTNDSKDSTGDVDLDALSKQALSLGNASAGGKDKGKKNKSGEIDLDALAKQAASLGK